MAKQIKPRNDNLVIKKLDSKVKEESVLELPDNPQEFEEAYIGEVIAVGPGRKSPEGYRYEIDLNEEDRVLYKQYAGHLVKEIEDEDTVWLINEKDILAKFNN